MKKLPAYVFIMAAAIGAGSGTGCADPLCVTTIKVVNESATNQSYEVVIDDELVGTLAPGQTGSYEMTSRAHTVQVNFATGGVACSSVSLLLRECQTSGVVCEA